MPIDFTKLVRPSPACLVLAVLCACATTADGLAGSHWRLVEFQSMSDEIGTLRPSSSDAFTLRLNADGTVNLRLDCNRASGRWSFEPGPNGDSGRFGFGPLAGTRALCAAPQLDEKILRDAPFVRSYVVEGERLYLALMADAGVYVWQRED